MLRRSIFSASKVSTPVSPIPDEYQLVEYLESSGTQWLQIDLYNEHGFDCTFQRINFISASYSMLVGVNPVNLSYTQYARSINLSRLGFYPEGPDFSVNIAGIHKIRLYTISGDQKVYVDDTLIGSSSATYQYGTEGAGGYTSPKIKVLGDYRPPTVQIYGNIIFTDTINENTVENLFPVYRKSDSKPGMHDIVTNTFFTNRGTGEFTVGNPISWEDYCTQNNIDPNSYR